MVVYHIVLKKFCFFGFWVFWVFWFLVFLVFLFFLVFWFFWFFVFLVFWFFVLFVFWFSGFDTLVEDALVDTNSPWFWQPPRAFSVIFGNVPKQSEISKNFRKQNLSESSEGPHSEPIQFLLWTAHEHCFN